ncbi:hypothetical protein Amet_3446 [Alkaliphilus metalliredigens QYMF]|uniref:ATP-grasp domain-containing protein n=1 Tax=Alkaliphilus metalliredigens (strain QYMF) TaxID=293826 RepID=A6TTQ6_ALKMQ|nr:YheC/YheD family protein [Alkaliphilus metalliredigens]ABR49574.1 hypothetical protein Amet_3446 [Alkaliphilus metalliredigens QYMF]
MTRDNQLMKIHQRYGLFTLGVLNQESYKTLLFLNNIQLKNLKFTPGENLILRVGMTELQVEVATQYINPSMNMLYLSSNVLKDLYYYQGEPLKAIFISKNKFVLGPSLGLTISHYTWKNIDKSHAVKKRALLALEKGILFYCFILNRVNWETNLVKAYCLDPTNNEWVKKRIPLPQVIHDRGSYPGPETVESFNHKGKAHNIQWINTTRTFGKWETFQALSLFRKTSQYLPETALLTSSKLMSFLEKYKHCFIKNNYGRGGRQVVRIEKGEGFYICKTGGSEVKSWEFTDMQKLHSFLHINYGANLVLQQGIFLAKIHHCPFDMRILVQKKPDRRWVVSGLNFRIAKPEAIVTNFSAGARDLFVSPGEELFHAALSWDMLESFSLKTVYAMEKSFGSLGEVGLDVALDRDGKLWLLEANSRPSSIAYREASPEACEQIYGLPLEYASSLVKGNYYN